MEANPRLLHAFSGEMRSRQRLHRRAKSASARARALARAHHRVPQPTKDKEEGRQPTVVGDHADRHAVQPAKAGDQGLAVLQCPGQGPKADAVLGRTVTLPKPTMNHARARGTRRKACGIGSAHF